MRSTPSRATRSMPASASALAAWDAPEMNLYPSLQTSSWLNIRGSAPLPPGLRAPFIRVSHRTRFPKRSAPSARGLPGGPPNSRISSMPSATASPPRCTLSHDPPPLLHVLRFRLSRPRNCDVALVAPPRSPSPDLRRRTGRPLSPRPARPLRPAHPRHRHRAPPRRRGRTAGNPDRAQSLGVLCDSETRGRTICNGDSSASSGRRLYRRRHLVLLQPRTRFRGNRRRVRRPLAPRLLPRTGTPRDVRALQRGFHLLAQR